MDVLCCAFLLMAAWGASRRLRGSRLGVGIEVVAAAGAYASKETALVLPLFVIVEHWAHAGRPPLGLVSSRTALPAVAAHGAAALLYLALRDRLLPLAAPTVPLAGLDTVSSRVALTLESLGQAAVVAFAPHDLSIQRGLVAADGSRQVVFHPVTIAAGIALLVLCSGAVVFFSRRAPGLAIAALSFLLSLLPTANIVLSGMTTLFSERYLYIQAFSWRSASRTSCAVSIAPASLLSVWERWLPVR
jgi:hypothetical protein